jgi:Zn-dependent protease with chaperone function
LIQTGLGLTIAGEYVSQNDRELYAVYVGGGQYEIRERSSGVGGMMKILGILAIVFGWCMVIWAKLVSIFSLLLSRNQELEADDFAAELTSPAAMASALRQLEAAQLALDNQEMLALPYPDRWQVTPMKRSFIDRLWDTHPSTENRVSKMDALANALDFDTTLPALAEGSRDVESVSEEA